MKISLIQMNPVISDLPYNFKKIRHFYHQAVQEGSDLVVYPELCTTGYIPKDLFWNESFIENLNMEMQYLIPHIGKIPIVLPTVFSSDKQYTKKNKKPYYNEQPIFYNGLCIIHEGKMVHQQYKMHLPNHDGFYEKRWFIESQEYPSYWTHEGTQICFVVSTDLWHPNWMENVVDFNKHHPDYFIVVNAEPFRIGGLEAKKNTLQVYKHYKTPIFYLNQTGGHDNIIFDGSSIIMNSAGDIAVQMGTDEECKTIDTSSLNTAPDGYSLPVSTSLDYLVKQIKTGLKDYVIKNSFSGVLVGISGGIDSAVVATLAVDALGADHVIGVMMPSQFTSQESLEDAQALIHNLGIVSHTIPITDRAQNILQDVHNVIESSQSSLVYENVQARLRGLYLMTLSNSLQALVLNTGNKSELAVGYATLYGDMCGAYNPIKDIYKTQIFSVAAFLNTASVRIPERILTKPPSAELSMNQKDTDSLPSYDDLDPLLINFIQGKKEDVWTEEKKSVYKKYQMSEYKRHQGPPGATISNSAFDDGRQIPITLRFVPWGIWKMLDWGDMDNNTNTSKNH